MILGREPFPGGRFPDLPLGGDGGEVASTGGTGVVIKPAAWEALEAMQVVQGLMMALDAGYDAIVDGTAYYDDATLPAWLKFGKPWWVIWAMAHWGAYAVGDLPIIWGNPLPTRPPNADALPTAMWTLSILVNSADVGCAWKNGYFLAKFDEDKTGVGPFTLSLCGLGRIIMSVCRYYFLGSQSSTDVLNMWINVTSFEPSFSGFVRFLFKRNRDLVAVMDAKVFFDVVCDLFADIATRTRPSGRTAPADHPAVGLHADATRRGELRLHLLGDGRMGSVHVGADGRVRHGRHDPGWKTGRLRRDSGVEGPVGVPCAAHRRLRARLQVQEHPDPATGRGTAHAGWGGGPRQRSTTRPRHRLIAATMRSMTAPRS